MTKIDIFSGFLGSGKTTLIKKLIKEAYASEKVVLIENEFGEIGIDGAFLKEAGIEITEMNSGCICCSLVGDFSEALHKVLTEFSPDRILIEPSGVGKLSDVIKAVSKVTGEDATLNSYTTVVDVNKCKMYMKNFGEFFNDQIEHAAAIILSHTKNASDEKIEACVKSLREHNESAVVVTTDWDELSGEMVLAAMEGKHGLHTEIDLLEKEHHHHDEECDCGHDHHEHEHHHHHGEECDCGCDHHGHHHADDVFSSWGIETTKKYSAEEINEILDGFSEDDGFGMILRAKGVVYSNDGRWIHFDYVPGEPDVRYGAADIIGKICVIGSHLDKEKIAALFEK